jgi:hypothetical protein
VQHPVYSVTLSSRTPFGYVTAYAINSIGTAYGEEKSFLTIGEEPVIDEILDYQDLTINSVVLRIDIRPAVCP